MLNDIRDLLEEDDDLYPSGDDDGSRRRIIIIGGVLGGIILLAIVCFGVYALVIGNDDDPDGSTATSRASTQLAMMDNEPTATPLPPTPTETPLPPSETPESSPTFEPSPSAAPTDTTTPEPTDTPVPTLAPTTTPSLIFQENFEGSGGVWPTTVRDNYEYGIVDGRFVIKVSSSFIEAWTVRERIFEGARTEADLLIASGTDDGYAGLICNFQDGFNFYAGIVYGSGEYAIVRRFGTELIELAGPAQSSGVNNAGTENRVRFDCNSGELTLNINGVQVLQAVDDAYLDGQVGLVGGTLAEAGLEAAFDDYIIARP